MGNGNYQSGLRFAARHDLDWLAAHLGLSREAEVHRRASKHAHLRTVCSEGRSVMSKLCMQVPVVCGIH